MCHMQVTTFFSFIFSLLSQLYLSILRASLLISLLFLGLETDVTLPATLFLCEGSVAECCPRLLELICLELHSRVLVIVWARDQIVQAMYPFAQRDLSQQLWSVDNVQTRDIF